MNKSSTSGQILVLVLLVVLVGMSIGLSIASRTLSNLKDTTSLNLSNRAFNGAEAGIELALTKLNADASACNSNCWVGTLSGVDSVNVHASAIGNSVNAVNFAHVKRDDVVPINLETYAGTTLRVYWGSLSDQGKCTTDVGAMVISVVYKTGSTYGMSKIALDKCAADASHANNFDSASVSETPTYTPGSGIVIQDGTTKNDYGYMASLNLVVGGSLIPTGSTPLMARIRLMYADDKQIAIAPVGAGINLPSQGQQITSTAVAGSNQRTVKVVRSNATLPAIFDYALFNGSTQTLSK
jgi:hypothetical protein